jgi:hypothetical protein
VSYETVCVTHWRGEGRRYFPVLFFAILCRLRLKCDGTRAETRFRLSAKRTSPFKSAGRQFSRLLAAEVCATAVVMLDTPCSKVVWRVLPTHSIRQFPLHFPSLASPCAITSQLDSTSLIYAFHADTNILCSWYSIVQSAARRSGAWLLQEQLFSAVRPDQLWGPPRLLFRRYCWWSGQTVQ